MHSSNLKRAFLLMILTGVSAANTACVRNYSVPDLRGGLMTLGDVNVNTMPINVATNVIFTRSGRPDNTAAAGVQSRLREMLAVGPVLRADDMAKTTTLRVIVEHTPDPAARSAGTAAGATLGLSKRTVKDRYSFRFTLRGTPGFDRQGTYPQSVLTTFGGKVPSGAQSFEGAFFDAFESALAKFLVDVHRTRSGGDTDVIFSPAIKN